ncbi:MAG: FAD-binding oxidoreductase [Thermoplasmatales archaeon]
MSFLGELKGILGDYLITDPIGKLPYSRDASYLPGSQPVAVALPETVEQLKGIMRICYDHGIQVTPRGGGTSLTGSSIPSAESIVVSFARMNRIIEINTADRYVHVEAGVRLDDLNSALSKLNFMYPPDPGSSIAATVGGSISTNAGGLRGVSYGATKEWVLGLEVVLSDGSVIHTGGKVLKRSDGYDLTALMVGSEGTLGLVTSAYLKVVPKPEKVGRIIAYYNKIDGASTAISSLKSRGITPLMAEFLDRIAMDSIRKTKGMAFPEDANYLIMVDISSTVESIERMMNDAYNIISSTNPISVTYTMDEAEMDNLSKIRKGIYSSELSQRRTEDELVITGDVVVPTTQLSSALVELENAKRGMMISLFGHLGDGNIHANIFFNSKNSQEVNMAEDYLKLMARIAIKLGGSISAEHGIGLEKKELFAEEMNIKNSNRSIEIMRGIKGVMDPKGILNGGKIF